MQQRNLDLQAGETVLTMGCAFGLRLRQSEGLMLSLLGLMGLDLPIPDHTALSRRAQVAEIDQFTADGAYGGGPTYGAVLQHSAAARIIIPPRITAVQHAAAEPDVLRTGSYKFERKAPRR